MGALLSVLRALMRQRLTKNHVERLRLKSPFGLIAKDRVKIRLKTARPLRPKAAVLLGGQCKKCTSAPSSQLGPFSFSAPS